MKTHCSLVDESFVDYLCDQDEYNYDKLTNIS